MLKDISKIIVFIIGVENFFGVLCFCKSRDLGSLLILDFF